MTYSRCCQRPRRPPRLPTLVLPLTAPTAGSPQPVHQVGQRVRLEDGVTVDEHEHVMAGHGDAGVQRGWLAAVGLPEHPDAGQPEPGRYPRRAVGGAVVDDDHLQRAPVPGVHQGGHGRRDAGGLVVGGNHHGHARRVPPERPLPDRLGYPAPVRAGEADQQQRPGHRQDGGHHQHDRQCGDGVVGRLLGDDQRKAGQALAGGGRHVRRWQPQPGGDGHEPVPPGPQPGDDPRQRRDGLRPVPAGVVQHDDRAPAAGGHGRRGDPGHPGTGPVAGVEAGQHDEIPVAAGLPVGVPVGCGDRVRPAAVRRAQQAGVHPGCPRERVLGQRELQLLLPPACQVDMGVGVRPHLVAVPQFLADDPRVGRRVRAHHEERGWHLVVAQDGQDPRGPGRVRPVVEGQRHRPGWHRVAARAGASPVDDRAAADHGPGGWRPGRGRLGDGRAGLAEHPMGVSLHQQAERAHQQEQADQQPVTAGCPGPPVTVIPAPGGRVRRHWRAWSGTGAESLCG